jgi:hypothetical protein
MIIITGFDMFSFHHLLDLFAPALRGRHHSLMAMDSINNFTVVLDAN